jgi:hypothetical protein
LIEVAGENIFTIGGLPVGEGIAAIGDSDTIERGEPPDLESLAPRFNA